LAPECAVIERGIEVALGDGKVSGIQRRTTLAIIRLQARHWPKR